jgi:hypothetical protein
MGHNEEYNMWLINLSRASGATLDLASTVDEAFDKLKITSYDVVISDTIELFQQLKDQEHYVKIINAGADYIKTIKPVTKQVGVHALVDKDALLLRAILKMHVD